jgi:hypothetical protein
MLPLFLQFKNTTSNQLLKKMANTNCYNQDLAKSHKQNGHLPTISHVSKPLYKKNSIYIPSILTIQLLKFDEKDDKV